MSAITDNADGGKHHCDKSCTTHYPKTTPTPARRDTTTGQGKSNQVNTRQQDRNKK